MIHPTGTGKSFIAYKCAEDNPNGRFVWLSPPEDIFNVLLENVRYASGLMGMQGSATADNGIW